MLASMSGQPGRVAGELGRRQKRAAAWETPTFAFASTDGGMILSGPNACRGSTKDARILPVFLHSPALLCQLRSVQLCDVTTAAAPVGSKHCLGPGQ